MKHDDPPARGDKAQIEALESIYSGNIAALRRHVGGGFDLNRVEQGEDTLLEKVIHELEWHPEVSKHEVVRELIRLGADPRVLSSDGSGPLFAAVLNMDTEMLRILLDAGADPNLEKMDSEVESLYDWAEWDYRYEVWDVNPPEEATAEDKVDEDAWLKYLDRLAIKYGKRRPDHLLLLRQRGALSMAELRKAERGCNQFELRLADGVSEGKNLTDGTITLDSEIWVDGQHLDEPHFIDLPLLVQSLHVQGQYEIFTCGRGVGGCAGIVDGIQVTHEAGLIRWSFRRPQSAGNLLDPALSEWEKTAVPVALTFERAQMLSAIQTYLDRVRALVGNRLHRFGWPVHGLSVQDVLKIDPNRPLYEIRDEE